MSRLQPVEKTCLQCNKTFLAKRSDAKFCGNACRANYSVVLSAKPAIVAEANREFAEKIKPYMSECSSCGKPTPCAELYWVEGTALFVCKKCDDY